MLHWFLCQGSLEIKKGADHFYQCSMYSSFHQTIVSFFSECNRNHIHMRRSVSSGCYSYGQPLSINCVSSYPSPPSSSSSSLPFISFVGNFNQVVGTLSFLPWIPIFCIHPPAGVNKRGTHMKCMSMNSIYCIGKRQ